LGDDLVGVTFECDEPASAQLQHLLKTYPDVTDIRWVQEEPANQGAWCFLTLHLPELLPGLPN
jgi:2-oxoglutarate dehydrogenase complex dehydrogenase (E1) component-like enzyme